ncbi:MAG TPA: hypothetical protein VGK43_00410 [Solirubrobacterales bacterium]
MRGIPADYYPDDLEPVPSLAELAAKGLARVIERNKDGKATIVVPSPEGQALIYATMSRNAERMRANHERRNHEGVREEHGGA